MAKTTDEGGGQSVPTWVSAALLAFFAYITHATMPDPLVTSQPTIQHVWFYGWVTALSTGFGTAPFVFMSEINDWWLGVSNAIAAGMMICASYCLMKEGAEVVDEAHKSFPPVARVFVGVLAGLLFIYITKKVLDQYEDIKVAGMTGIDAKKVLLIVLVMTVHSFSEGVGIGVAFGGDAGQHLGAFISVTLAVHNVPEGLAVALVLIPRGISLTNTALWCILTSLPQPLMAVPAFIFVEKFVPILPIGLGFAAGAMGYVAFSELLPEALANASKKVVIVSGILSFLGMIFIQEILK